MRAKPNSPRSPRRQRDRHTPLAVWQLAESATPTEDGAEVRQDKLVERVICEYARPGEHVLVAMARTGVLDGIFERVAEAPFVERAKAHHPELVDLCVIGRLPMPSKYGDLANLADGASQVSLGGLIAVIPNTKPSRAPETLAKTVSVGKRRGLGYIQHVVALPAKDAAAATRHRDVLVFRVLSEVTNGQ